MYPGEKRWKTVISASDWERLLLTSQVSFQIGVGLGRRASKPVGGSEEDRQSQVQNCVCVWGGWTEKIYLQLKEVAVWTSNREQNHWCLEGCSEWLFPVTEFPASVAAGFPDKVRMGARA